MARPAVPRYLRQYQPRPRIRFLAKPAESVKDLDLILHLEHGELGRRRVWEGAAGSIMLHVVVIAGLLSATAATVEDEEAGIALRYRDSTSLVAPPPELLRQLGRSRELTLEQLMARPGSGAPQLPPGPPRPFRPPPVAEAAKREAPPVEPPKIESLKRAMATPPGSALPPGLDAPAPAAPPQIQPQEGKPKLAFETPGPGTFSSAGSPPQGGVGARPGGEPSGIQRPSSSVQQAIEEVARSGGVGKGLVIGDVELPGGVVEARNVPPAPGNAGSNIEMLSDPKGVDFRPYLIRVLSAVRRNWQAVIPQSAKLGRRGKVVIQFAIDRTGQVPKLVIAVPSGAEALDRAAVAGISASNPFPPLPPEFTGGEIRLQLNFLYNIKR